MTKLNRFKTGMIILAVFLIIIIINRVLTTPLEISNASIEQIDKNTVRINWSTNKETYSGIDIDEPEKVREIFRNAFSCNITGDLIIEGSSEDTFKKYGCTFSKNKDGVPIPVHDGVMYGNCATDSRFFLCKGSENVNSKQHSVIINVLQPNTEYTFKIRAKVEPPGGWAEEFAEKSVKFKMI